jgi:hypothetical protein
MGWSKKNIEDCSPVDSIQIGLLKVDYSEC